MPRVTIYIRDEDWNKWQSIENKPEFLSEAINKLEYFRVRREAQLKKVKQYQEKHKEKYRAEGRRRMREYRKSPEFRFKERARSAVRTAIKKGHLERASQCEQCLSSYRIEAHHEDYSKQLEVMWLCRPCHELIHHP